MNAPAPATGRIPVLTLLTNLHTGGTERQVVNLVRHHDRSRFDVHLACFRLAGKLRHEVDASLVRMSEYPITTLASPRTLFQQGRLLRYLRRHHIQIVNAFGFYANVFAIPVARLAGTRVVVASIRDNGDALSGLQTFMQKWVCRAADHVLVNAEGIRTVLLRQAYDPARISVIRNGIDMSRFPDRRDSAAVRTSFGFPPAAPVVAVFARLTRIKGVEYFLEAAAMLKARFEEARFLIVGEDFYEDHRAGLEALARTLGLDSRVVFAGFREDVPDLLREVAVSVLPSLGGEGLPNVVLEAMAAGVPVVATRVGGTPELIEDGIQGLLVPPRDPGALALAIGSLLAEPRRRRSMGQAGRERAGKEFSIEAGVHATETLYERLLTGGRRLPAPSGSPAGHAARARLSPASRPLGDEDRS